ncbi:DNA-binding protein [Francisellaceae bacterium]|nr:DNA-binding protein [Francisellaceae bacterium]
MARTGISYEDVVSVIENLMVNGEKPTILKIREALGGSGSPNTISKYLKQWKESALASNKSKTPLNITEEINQPSDSINDHVEPMSDNKSTNSIENPTAKQQLESLSPSIQALIDSSKSVSSELLNAMSTEWNIILNEKDEEIKIRKLHAALIKEQTRREASEKVAQESKLYSETLKSQVAQRITELKDSLESEIAFLNGQIRKLKKESEADIDYYRAQIEKANNKLINIASK